MACPSSVVIVGSGVFGLSTAYAMSRDATFAKTKITLVDCWEFEPDSKTSSVHNDGAAHADTTRVIRSDYAHGPYCMLAREAHQHWRADFGADKRYVEQRLLFSGKGSSLENPKRPGETVNYVKNAYNLSREMNSDGKYGLKLVDTFEDIRTELGIPANHPQSSSLKDDKDAYMLRGYISENCGWANAGKSVEWLRQEVIRLGRVEMRTGRVTGLVISPDGQQVQGVRLSNGEVITAELSIVAAGHKSSDILSVPKLCDVYSQFVAYIQLTDDEASELRRRNWPLIVNTHRGVFSVGPDHDNRLKLGRFSQSGAVDVGDSCGITIPPRADEPDDLAVQQKDNPKFGWGGDVTISATGDIVDYESDRINKTLAEYRGFLLELMGPSSLDGFVTAEEPTIDHMLNSIAVRPFMRVRKCWYNDTPGTHFIVDYHPSYGKSLFVATGGNDHAFKFLPIIGEKVAAIALHRRGVTSVSPMLKADAWLGELCELWKFPVHFLQSGKKAAVDEQQQQREKLNVQQRQQFQAQL